MTKRITTVALFTTIALIIFVVEAQIPALIPIPGVKLGLANIVTIYTMFRLGPRDTLLVLLGRVILGAVFAGQVMALIYSLSGGLLCYALMLLLRKIVTENQIFVCGVLGGVAHNLGQMAAAIAVVQTPSLIVYLPIMLVSGIITGAFTGLCAQYLLKHMNMIKK